MPHLATRTRPRLLAPLLAAALLGAACGDDTDDETQPAPEAAPAVEQIDGHDPTGDDHDLAVGSRTPTDPQGRYFLHHGDTGPDVVTLQERLTELGARVGAADGTFGDRTLAAVLDFQRSEGLTPDGVVGTATWAALDDPPRTPTWETEAPAEPPTPESAAAPPDSTGPPTTVAPAARSDGHAVGPSTAPPEDPAAGAGAWSRAVITLSTQTATFYDRAGNVTFQAPVSSGKNGLTPTGTFHVQSKSQRAFAGNGVYMDWMTRFNGGIGFHSIPKRASGADIPTPLGQRPVSHGCIRMADENAQRVFRSLPIGAVVEVHA